MDGPTSSEEGLQSPPQDHKIDALTTKKRRVIQRNVVTVRVEARVGKQKGEAPPSDSWSWRKYGQKPIKGSPYPRGYYRCSTSKGCSAKKQVERCRTDASVLIITYTSRHNHPDPDIPSNISLTTADLLIPPCEQVFLPTEICKHGTSNERPSPQKPVTEETSTEVHDHLVTSNEKATTPSSGAGASSIPKSEESDFFDELEELPICTSFTGLGMSSFFDDGILLPS